MTDPIEALRRQAKQLFKSYQAGHSTAAERLRYNPPRADGRPLKHADFLHVIARENNFPSWPQMKLAVETEGMDRAALQQRLKIALYHGQTAVVARLIAQTSDLARGAFGLQVALYDLSAVRATLADDPGAATRAAGPRRPMIHLAYSKMIHAWPEKADDMIAIAELLLANGADVNDSYAAQPGSDHQLSALYGAVGHADNMRFARWLLAKGADPNDGESLYHATEIPHHDGLEMLLEYGAKPGGTNALLRAMDFDDPVAVDMLLKAGADPNEAGTTPALHHAARRVCGAEVTSLLLDAGADPSLMWDGVSAFGLAAVFGNRALFEQLDGHPAVPPLTAQEEVLVSAAWLGPKADQWMDPAKLPDVYRNIITDIVTIPGKLDHVKALVGLGLEPDRPDASGVTPVQLAGWEGLPEMMAYLLSQLPDLTHVNDFGGTLLSTIIHGSENCPARAKRDHIACLQLALDHGVALPKRAIEMAGMPEVATLLANWAEAHPGQVVAHGIA